MTDFSILDIDESSKSTVALSPYFIDFNIDRIVKDINAYWKEDVSALYKYFPIDEEGQEYRKAVYQDICKEGVYDILMEFRKAMKQRQKMLEDKKHTRSGLQQIVMTLGEINLYSDAVAKLSNQLSKITLESKGMTELVKLIDAYVSSEEFKQLKDKARELRDALDSIPIKLSYNGRFLNVSFEEVEGKYDTFLNKFSGQQSLLQKKNPLGDAIEVTMLEEEVLDIVYSKYKKTFDGLEAFVNAHLDYSEEFILKFADEIAFYLSFYTFELAMYAKGLYFVMPKKSENNRLAAEDLYDLALACQMLKDGGFPIANDMRLEDGENFFVLTGPNQGGKTTFARSLGQLVFFSKLGLPVPAKRAEIPFYSRILTHFSVEESVETGKGKLAEELSRLAPMMKDITEEKSQKNDFVVINELFTTAANYDACIMGKRVLDHFIGQNCHGIYVTHLQELSKEDKGIVSLRAMMNEEHRQNFKIVRSTEPALESSIILVEKHKLQYEQVKDRLRASAQ